MEAKDLASEAVFRFPTDAGDTYEEAVADLHLSGVGSNAATVMEYTKSLPGTPDLQSIFDLLRKKASAAYSGNADGLPELFAAQVYTLNAIFTELTRRSLKQWGEDDGAAVRYLEVALEAQKQGIAAVEALLRMTGASKANKSTC